MTIISNKSLYVNNNTLDRCYEINLKAQMVLLIATLLLVLPISINALTPLKAFIKSTTLRKLPPNQSDASISNNRKSSSKNNTAGTIIVGKQSTQPKISIAASFFSIYEFVKAVGGNRIDVSSHTDRNRIQ